MSAILGLTANAEKDTQQECLESGMDDVITKPIRRKPLLNAINKLIAQRNGDSPAVSEKKSSNEIPAETQGKNEPLDYETALEEFGSTELIEQLAVHLIDKVEKQIEIMTEALQKNDMQSLSRESHSIKGGASTLEAQPLAELAKQLEKLSKANQIDDIPNVFDKFINEFDRLREFIANISQLKNLKN